MDQVGKPAYKEMAGEEEREEEDMFKGRETCLAVAEGPCSLGEGNELKKLVAQHGLQYISAWKRH
jgi:hypothetical protein